VVWPQSSRSSRPPETAAEAATGWSVTAAGTVGFDDLATTAGHAEAVPGGSALYFTLAAHRFCRVWPVAAVGQDGVRLVSLLSEGGVAPAGIAQLPGRSYRWRAVHDPDAQVPSFEEQSFGVYSNWRPKVPKPARASEILFLGSMAPPLQQEVLRQVARAKLVALDTMRDFIVADRSLLLELVAQADLLFANSAELAALTGSRSEPEAAARQLLGKGRLRAVVVKLGRKGAALVTPAGERAFTASRVELVVDPTGAGDSLAGGMLGRLAQLRRSDEPALYEAISEGLASAARAISAFGPAGLDPK
jgi:sugar/nucleoside kinase (ribokinase family)